MRWNNEMRDKMRIKLDYNNMMDTFVGDEGFTEKDFEAKNALGCL